MTDFRALCAEVIEKVEFTWGGGIPEDVKELLNRLLTTPSLTLIYSYHLSPSRHHGSDI